ncbi:MAG: hypothetical protein O2794_00970 [bacterium]|nr:hypothetical protein [bacterium]
MREGPEQPEDLMEEREMTQTEELLLGLSRRINRLSPRGAFEEQRAEQHEEGPGGNKFLSFASIFRHDDPAETHDEIPLSPEDHAAIENFIVDGDEVLKRHEEELQIFLVEHRASLEKAGITIEPEKISEICTQLVLEFLRGEMEAPDPDHQRDRYELSLLLDLERKLRAEEAENNQKQ